VLPENLALRVPIFVGPTAEAMFEGHAYSMPPKAANVAGTAFVYENRIHFVVGRWEVEHRRRSDGDPPAPLPEHRAEKLAAVHGARARTYEMRQQLLNLGNDAMLLLTALVHRAPERQVAQVETLYALLVTHGDDAMRAALERVRESGDLTEAAVRRILEPRAQRSRP
jgi:hypothetical protein